MKYKQPGFTVVEIAIVLVIIGLMLGGLLKLRELINGAKTKNLAADITNVAASVKHYQEQYKALPGDDPNVGVHLGAASRAVLATTPTASFGVACTPPAGLAGCVGNGLIDGAWNSRTPTDEAYLFWQHVRLAGLAPGSTIVTDPAYLPANAWGGMIGVQSGTKNLSYTPIKDKNGRAIRGAYIVCSAGVPGKFAKSLDVRMDDGSPDSGLMLATPENGYRLGAAARAAAAIDDSASYVVCMGMQ